MSNSNHGLHISASGSGSGSTSVAFRGPASAASASVVSPPQRPRTASHLPSTAVTESQRSDQQQKQQHNRGAESADSSQTEAHSRRPATAQVCTLYIDLCAMHFSFALVISYLCALSDIFRRRVFSLHLSASCFQPVTTKAATAAKGRLPSAAAASSSSATALSAPMISEADKAAMLRRMDVIRAESAVAQFNAVGAMLR
jgi:hypothetical protein